MDRALETENRTAQLITSSKENNPPGIRGEYLLISVGGGVTLADASTKVEEYMDISTST
jgi:hypothetical protein